MDSRRRECVRDMEVVAEGLNQDFSRSTVLKYRTAVFINVSVYLRIHRAHVRKLVESPWHDTSGLGVLSNRSKLLIKGK